MISIIDSTTEQARKLGVSFQLDFHLNKVCSNFYTPSMGSVLLFVCLNWTLSLSSSWLTEQKLALAFHKGVSKATIQGLSSLTPRPMTSLDMRLRSTNAIVVYHLVSINSSGQDLLCAWGFLHVCTQVCIAYTWQSGLCMDLATIVQPTIWGEMQLTSCFWKQG